MISNRPKPAIFSSTISKNIVALIICALVAGCALIKLREEVQESLVSTILVGRVTTQFPGKGPIIVAAYTKSDGKINVAHYSVLHDFGEYELMVAQGDYYGHL